MPVPKDPDVVAEGEPAENDITTAMEARDWHSRHVRPALRRISNKEHLLNEIDDQIHTDKVVERLNAIIQYGDDAAAVAAIKELHQVLGHVKNSAITIEMNNRHIDPEELLKIAQEKVRELRGERIIELPETTEDDNA